MDTYGVGKPFSNIIKAEATHISLLEPLFEEYDISVPEKEWESLVVLPETLDAAYLIGVDAEEKNIAMYESFLKENLPDDIREVFEALMNASEKHLAAFQRQLDGVIGVSGSQKWIWIRNRNSNWQRQWWNRRKWTRRKNSPWK